MTPFEHLKQAILAPEDFISARFQGVQAGHSMPWQRLSIRPLVLRQVRHWQISYFDGKRDFAKNYSIEAIEQALEEVFALPFKHWHVYTRQQTLQVGISKKGKALLSSHSPSASLQTDLSHDRAKQRAYNEHELPAFMQAIGISTADRRIKAEQRHKFKQINEFLRLLQESNALEVFGGRSVSLVDFGCGSAALTFAAHAFLRDRLGLALHSYGIDIKQELITRHQATAQALAWQDIHFEYAYISDFQPPQPADVVIALHACNTATDDAIAQGIGWQSHMIVCAPCCHQHLNAQLERRHAPEVFAPLLRYGLFHKRIGDMLTDSLRGALLRALGYQVDMIEFVSPEHTPQNLLIRAVRIGDFQASAWQEYCALRDAWQVTPYLETILRERGLLSLD